MKFERRIKYCELDCKILYDIIRIFSETIYTKFRIDVIKYSTTSSLSFAIYRSNYLSKNEIPIINNNLYKALRLSYTGGAVDVFKPTGKNIYYYDVNGLYAYIMKEMDMPANIFRRRYFIFKENPDAYGFFEVKVQAPLDLDIPLLQKRIKTENGYRTVAPLGNWTGVYFSDKLKEAKKLGYKFEILRGYLFEKKNLFKEFIVDLNEQKENSLRNSSDYLFILIINEFFIW